MTGAEKQLVERALLEILPILDAVGAGFYTRLVALDPTLRGFLPADRERQIEIFRETLGVLVALLDSPQTVRPLLAEWGGRLRARGVPRDAYATAGEAWLALLGLALPPGSDAMQGAWASFYAEVVAVLEAPVRAPGARAGEMTTLQPARGLPLPPEPA